MIVKNVTVSLLLSKHMPLRQQVHGDDPLSNSHKQQLQFEAGDSPNLEAHAVRHIVCHKTRSLDNPSDRHGTLLLDIPRQKACCAQRVVILLSMVLSVPIPWGKQVLPQCPHGRGHVPGCTSNYNSWALAG